MKDGKLRQKRILYGVLSAAVMAVIFCFSAQNGYVSGDLSGQASGIIGNFLRLFLPKEWVEWLFLTLPIRKAAHVFIYFCLGITVSLFFGTFAWEKEWNSVLASVAFCFLYAVSDEIHQCFVPLREGKFSDVLIDAIGFVSASGMSFLFTRWKARKNLR